MSSSLPAHILAKAVQEQRKGEEQELMVHHQQLKECYKDLATSLKAQMDDIQEAKKVILEQLEKFLEDNKTVCVPLSCKTKFLRKTESTRTNTVTKKVVEDAFMLAMTESSFEEAYHQLIEEAQAVVKKAEDEARARFSMEITAKKAKVQERLHGLPESKIKMEKKRVKEELEKEQAARPDNPDLAEAKAKLETIKNQPLLVDVMEQAIQSVFRKVVTKVIEKVEISGSKPRGFSMASAVEMPQTIQDLCEELQELSQKVPEIPDLSSKLKRAQTLLGAAPQEQEDETSIDDVKTMMEKVESKIQETRQEFTGTQISIVRDGDDDDDVPKVENFKIYKREATIRAAPPLRLTTVRPLVRETLVARVADKIYSPDTAKEVLSSVQDLQDLQKQILIAMAEYKARETQKAEVVAVRKRKLNLKNSDEENDE